MSVFFYWVSGLGQFSLIGRLFTLGSQTKMKEVCTYVHMTVAEILGILRAEEKCCMYVGTYLPIGFVKKWVGLHFGRFFSNSSCHTGLSHFSKVRSFFPKYKVLYLVMKIF
jgi:hypothetical protein